MPPPSRWRHAGCSVLLTPHQNKRQAFLIRDNQARSTNTGRSGLAEHGRFITWMGSVQRINTVGPVDRSITIEPMRRCPKPVPLDGSDGILAVEDAADRAWQEQKDAAQPGSTGLMPVDGSPRNEEVPCDLR